MLSVSLSPALLSDLEMISATPEELQILITLWVSGIHWFMHSFAIPMAPKLPIRLHEVVYTLSPFEQSVMSGLWKDFSYKFTKQIREVGV